MKTKPTFILLPLLLALLLGTVACDKENPNNCDEICLIFESNDFCLYVSIDEFHNTAPFINSYLRHIQKDGLSEEEQLQELAQWLESKPSIVRVEDPVFEISWQPQSSIGYIRLFYDDRGIEREIELHLRRVVRPTPNDPTVPIYHLGASYYQWIRARTVIVHFSSRFFRTFDDVFDFINEFDHEVASLMTNEVRGTIPGDSVSYFRSYLSAKPYVPNTAMIQWLNNAPAVISITMVNMENKEYQADWLKFAAARGVYIDGGGMRNAITFLVLDGKEREWKTIFETHEKIFETQINYVNLSFLTRNMVSGTSL